jgi:PKD repeat protein
LKNLLFIFFLLSLRFYGQTCTAAFSYAAQAERLIFNNNSTVTNAHYYWNFGDGTSSNYKDPIHEFSDNGKYLVTLYVNDTITNCSDYFEAWIIAVKTNSDLCSPFLNDSVYLQNGNTYVKFLDSAINCINYGVDYKVGWYSGSGKTRLLTKYPANYILSAYYSQSGVFKRATYKTCLNNYYRSKNYQDCSANFEFAVVSENQTGQRIKFTAMNKNAKTYRWAILGFGSPIWVNTDTTSMYYPDNINSTVQNIAWTIFLATEGYSGCKDSVLQSFVIQKRAMTYVNLKEEEHLSHISVWPNPTSDKIYIDMEAGISFNQMSIVNTIGQVVFEKSNLEPKMELNLSYLAKGLYFLQLRGRDRQKTLKIVME